MKFELFGIARARAGQAAVQVDAPSLAAALRALATKCPGLVPEILSESGDLNDSYLCSLNGDRFVRDPSLALSPSDAVLILGAQAGG